MIASMIRPMIRSMVSSMIPSDVESRVFIEGDSVLETHYVVSSPIVPAGDFTAAGEFSTSSSGANMVLLGEQLHFKLEMDVGGQLKILFGNGAAWLIITGLSPLAYNDGKLRSFEVIKAGTNYSLKVDGIEVISVTDASSVSPEISHIGQNGVGTQYFDGIIANVVINDIDAGEITTFRLDEPTANFELPVENVFGSEEVVNGDFSDGLNNWTVTEAGQTVEVVGGRLHIVTDGTGAGVAQTIPDLVPIVLEFDFEAVSGSLKVQVGSTTFVVSTTGHYIFTAVAASANMFVFRNSGAAEGYFDNISIKQVTNAITYVNIPESIRDTYTLVDDGVNWIGDTNFWDNTPSIIGSDWTDNGGGNYIYIGDGSFNQLADSILTVGESARVTFNVNSISGTMKEVATGDIFNTAGQQQIDIISISNTTLGFSRNTGIADCDIENISAKRLIEIA